MEYKGIDRPKRLYSGQSRRTQTCLLPKHNRRMHRLQEESQVFHPDEQAHQEVAWPVQVQVPKNGARGLCGHAVNRQGTLSTVPMFKEGQLRTKKYKRPQQKYIETAKIEDAEKDQERNQKCARRQPSQKEYKESLGRSTKKT